MRALITGVGGFVGRHLAQHLLDQGVEVFGLVRKEPSTELRSSLARVSLHQADLLHETEVREALEQGRPDLVFHLAAQSSVSRSWEDPQETLANNILGQLHLLQATVAVGLRPRILIVGSNEEYGAPRPEELPVRESNPLRPLSPYALSKVGQDLMGYQYFVSHGLWCVRVRPFNHIGPGQRDAFVASAFARQVAEAEAGLREPVIRVGNLEAQRDFTDVRDMVQAYRLALEYGEPGEVYNLGSERAVPVQQLLDFFIAQARVPIRVEPDPARLRPADVPCIFCDASRFRARTGWKPRIPLERTLSDVLEYWRQQVRAA